MDLSLVVFHYVNASISLLTVIYVILLTNLFVTKNWNVISGRVFANKDRFKQFLERLIILLTVYATAMASSHIINFFTGETIQWVAALMHVVSLASIFAAVYLLYDLLTQMSTGHVSSDEE